MQTHTERESVGNECLIFSSTRNSLTKMSYLDPMVLGNRSENTKNCGILWFLLGINNLINGPCGHTTVQHEVHMG